MYNNFAFYVYVYIFIKKIMRDPTERESCFHKVVNLRSIISYFILLFVNQLDHLNA